MGGKDTRERQGKKTKKNEGKTPFERLRTEAVGQDSWTLYWTYWYAALRVGELGLLEGDS